MEHTRQTGFTLLEVLVSAMVMTTIILAIDGLFISNRGINRFANDLVIANEVGQQQMETYRNTPYANIPTGTTSLTSILSPYPQLRSPRSVTGVVTELVATQLKQINLTITYTDNGGTKTLFFSTEIASRGINE